MKTQKYSIDEKTLVIPTKMIIERRVDAILTLMAINKIGKDSKMSIFAAIHPGTDYRDTIFYVYGPLDDRAPTQRNWLVPKKLAISYFALSQVEKLGGFK